MEDPKNYKVFHEINATIQHLGQLPGGVWATAMGVKDLERAYKDSGPTSQTQHELGRLISQLFQIKEIIAIAESHLSKMADEIGWAVDYDEDRNDYVVTGPCAEDWE